MGLYLTARARLLLALAGSSLVSVCLFLAGALSNHSREFGYMIWNLFLAWVPLGITMLLIRTLRHKLWSSWTALLLTMVWIGFLPNTFYMISDFIHVQDVRRVDLLYDVVMFASFIFNGVIIGFLSLFLVHKELEKRVWPRAAFELIGLVLLLCSFAIYLGRDLRWNSWDVLLNPGGILVDVSDRVLHPLAHPQMFTTTGSFFVLLSSLYGVGWIMARVARQQRG